jgi:hypothetical protein
MENKGRRNRTMTKAGRGTPEHTAQAQLLGRTRAGGAAPLDANKNQLDGNIGSGGAGSTQQDRAYLRPHENKVQTRRVHLIS